MNSDQYQQKEMKTAKVYMHDRWAGTLTEDEDGYHFQYEEAYLEQPDSEAISLTLPLTSDPYDSTVLFPFFDGLIPEGWLLRVELPPLLGGKKNARVPWKIVRTKVRAFLVLYVNF